MKIMTSKQYKSLLKVIMQQDKKISELTAENKAYQTFINSRSLDFPNNSERGFSVSGTPKTPDLFSEF